LPLLEANTDAGTSGQCFVTAIVFPYLSDWTEVTRADKVDRTALHRFEDDSKADGLRL
jgi:hypothetical protein